MPKHWCTNRPTHDNHTLMKTMKIGSRYFFVIFRYFMKNNETKLLLFVIFQKITKDNGGWKSHVSSVSHCVKKEEEKTKKKQSGNR